MRGWVVGVADSENSRRRGAERSRTKNYIGGSRGAAAVKKGKTLFGQGKEKHKTPRGNGWGRPSKSRGRPKWVEKSRKVERRLGRG